jgi:subtilisin family serine protease
MSRDLEDLYDLFGITKYHSNGIYGQDVSVLIIDTGTEKKTTNIHGLAVASIISPSKDQEFLGIAPQAKVIVADVIDPHSIPIQKIIQAIKEGIRDKVDIICISLGTSDPWGPLQEVISEAYQNNILVFAAAGNSGERGYEFPAACQDAIAVASMNSARQPSPFNTRNDAVVVFAPGEKLRLPTGNHGELQEFSGTSFATPFAAGYAALVLSAKRLETGKKDAVLSRREMIDTLRNPEHFSLNCSDHTYVMDKTCTDFSQSELFVPTSKVQQDVASSFRIQVGFFVIATLLLFMFSTLLSRNK